jgi:hypothetical protein
MPDTMAREGDSGAGAHGGRNPNTVWIALALAGSLLVASEAVRTFAAASSEKARVIPLWAQLAEGVLRGLCWCWAVLTPLAGAVILWMRSSPLRARRDAWATILASPFVLAFLISLPRALDEGGWTERSNPVAEVAPAWAVWFVAIIAVSWARGRAHQRARAPIALDD